MIDLIPDSPLADRLNHAIATFDNSPTNGATDGNMTTEPARAYGNLAAYVELYVEGRISKAVLTLALERSDQIFQGGTHGPQHLGFLATDGSEH